MLRPGYFLEKENVIAIDYDTFFNHQKISFIKIDVEGAELDVIKGMKHSIIKYQPVIACEVLDCHNLSTYNFIQERATELSSLLLSLNYSIIKLVNGTRKSKLLHSKKLEQ